jgi:hypothetical protein
MGRTLGDRVYGVPEYTVLEYYPDYSYSGNTLRSPIEAPLIEVLFVKVTVFILLLFATLPECSQNQTAVSDTLRLLSDF